MIKLPSAIGLVILLILSELQWTLLIHASDDSLIAGNSLLDGDPISSNGTSTSTFSPSDFYIVDFNETDSPHELPILSLSSLPSSSASSSSSSSSSTSPPSLTDSLLPSSSLTSAESASSASFSLPTDFINNSSSSANFSITYQLDDLHSESSFQHNRQDIGPWVKHDSNPGYGNRPSSSSSFNSESNDDYDEDGKSGPVHRPSSSIYNRPSYQHGGPSSHSYPTSSPSPSSSSSSGKSQILRHEYSYQPASGRSTGFKYNGPQVRQSHEDSSSSNKEDYRRVARKDMRRDHHENGNSGNPVGGPVVRHEWMNIDHGNSGSSEGNEGPIPPPNSQSHGPHHSYSNGNNNSPNNHNNNNQHPSKYQSSGYQAQPGPQHQPIQPPYAPQAQSTSDSDDTSWGNSQSSGDGSNEGSPSIQYDEPSMRQGYDEEASESEESEEDDEITSSGPEVIVKHQIHHHSQHQDQQHQTGPHIQQHHVTTINHPSPSGPTYPVPQAHGNNNNNHESATGLTKHDENYWNGPSSSMDGFSKFRKMKEAEKEGLMVLPMSRVQINSRADKPQKREYSVSTKYKKGKKYEKKYKKVKSKKKKKKKKCCKKKKCKKAKKCKPKKKKCKKPKKKCCEKEEKEWGEWPEMEVVFKKPKKKKKSKGWDSWGGYGDSYGSYEGKETEYLNAKDILGAEYLVEPPIGNADIYIEKKEPHSEEEEEEHEDEEEEDQKEDREDKEPAKIEPMSAIKQRETATGISEGGDNSGGANVQKNQQQSKQLKPVTKYEVDRPYEVHEVDMFPPKFESDPLNFGVSALGGGFDPMLNNARLDARFPGLTGPFSGQESNTENKGDIGRIKSKGSTIGNTRDSTRIGASVSLNNDGERSSATNENKYKKRPPQHPEIIDVDDVSASSKVETQSQQEQHPNHQPTDQQQTRVDLRDRSSVNNESGRGQVEGSSDWKKMNEPDEPWKANQAQIEGDRWSTDIIHRNDWRVGAKQPPPKSDDVVDP